MQLPLDNYPNPDILVDSDWLQEHIDDPNVRIVDCDPIDAFRRAHIRGAVGIPVHHYIKHPDYASDPNKYPLVAKGSVVKGLMESMGIGDDSLVVVYDSGGSLWATRFWWVLNHYGHQEVKVLDGGWNKWYDEGRSISTAPPSKKVVYFTPDITDYMVCYIDEGLSKIGDDATLFLDVRSDLEWDGTNSRGNLRSGRIPGAVHLEWLNFVSNDKYQTFKSAEELTALVKSVGVTPDKDIITY